MGLFDPAPTPKSALGYLKVLGPHAGVRVSPLCLGAMSFGEAWTEGFGKCDKKTSFEILDYFWDQGGNFIDTANNYQNEESETWLGEWMKARDNRDQMVIATKFTTGYKTYDFKKTPQQANYQGNHSKSLHLSVRDSLKKLQTDYIDLLYVHWWDFTTSIPEVMQSLNALVQRGVVLNLGISDTPAYIVAKANEYARNHGLRTFSVYQGRWNAADRDMEREIIPMCRDEGMAIAPWSALGGGNFKTQAQREEAGGRNLGGPSEAHLKVSEVLEKVAKRKGTIMTSVALAYVMHKGRNTHVFPIVGGRKIEHLKGNIEALKLKLSPEDIQEIEAATSFDVGFPLNFLYTGATWDVDIKPNSNFLLKSSANLDFIPDLPTHQPHSD